MSTSVFVVDVEPVGVVGVFTTHEAATDYFNEIQFDKSLDLTSGILEEYQLDVRDPYGFLIVRREKLGNAKKY